jgi:hypothetical protein
MVQKLIPTSVYSPIASGRLSTVVYKATSDAGGPDDRLHINLNQFCEKQRRVAIGPWANEDKEVISGQ